MLIFSTLLAFWQRLFRPDPPLKRPPVPARARTYSADSGYVYQYTFTGFRHILRSAENWTEYQFQLITGRAEPCKLSVLLPDERVGEWAARDRDLSASERYGIAKLTLKRALDRCPHPGALDAEIVPSHTDVSEIADELDL